MFLLVLQVIKNNWKMIAVGLAIVAFIGYIAFLKVEINHYKAKWQSAEAEIVAAKGREDRLAAANEGITAKYNQTLALYFTKAKAMNTLLQEKIKNDKELDSLRISAHAVELFNESKRNPSIPTPQTIEGNDGKASTPSTSLAVVFAKVAENDSNHWKCVAQVELWQSFWGDYEQAVLRTQARGPS